MNILKKSIAPITEVAWKEISAQASAIFKMNLTAREFVDIEGPMGLEQGGISTGRLIMPKEQSDDKVNYGIREVLPFIEIRTPFELSIWELDNLSRGAKDIDFEPLDKAAKDIALFEDTAIYKGFEGGRIKGLEESALNHSVTLPDDPSDFLKTIGAEINKLRKLGIQGPYSLVINEKKWEGLINLAKGYPILKQLKEIIGGQVIINHSNTNSYLITERGGDFELTLGQDMSIGYDSHTDKKIKLYFTETFTFRVLSPEAIALFT